MKRTGITLKYDDFTGEGYIKESKDFKKQSLLMQLDCIRDWLYDLEILYDIHHENYFKHPPKKESDEN